MEPPLPQHIAVMPAEVLQWIAPRPGDVVLDGTLGAGGHTRLLAEAVGAAGQVVSVDRDATAIAAAERNLKGLPVAIAHASYHELPEIVGELALAPARGIVLDLGLSSDQLADRERGFSYHSDGPLDLRFDTSEGQPAWQLLEYADERRIADILYEFGEERFSRRIARRIVERRRDDPVRTAQQLAQLVRHAVPNAHTQDIDAATRTFQALRIAVNGELELLTKAMATLPSLLAASGRIVVISFHSLEDRIVKQAFRDNAQLRVLTSKPVLPTTAEIAQNPRSRSAKMRVAERVA